MNLLFWLSATRPQTLLITLAPILLSQVLVAQEICQTGRLGQGVFSFSLALVILLCGLCLQIAVNLANDYYDYLSGVDSEFRTGPKRMAEKGLLSARAIHRAYWLFLTLGILTGLYLVWHSHAYLSLLGLFCVAAVMTYSSGPLPLAYHGLGELAVLLVFGPVAVMGGFYVQLGYLSPDVVWPSLAMGLLAAAIMLVNNIRDIPSDLAAGKNTVAAYVGEPGAKLLYALLLLAAALFCLMSLHQLPRVSYLLLPLTIWLCVLIFRRNGQQLNRQLGQTALLMMASSVAISLDLLLD